jgi:fructose-1,6-bisphosphatase I
MDHAAQAQQTDLMTITRHVLNEQNRNPESQGDFTILLSHIVFGCKFVASAVNKVQCFARLASSCIMPLSSRFDQY